MLRSCEVSSGHPLLRMTAPVPHSVLHGSGQGSAKAVGLSVGFGYLGENTFYFHLI